MAFDSDVATATPDSLSSDSLSSLLGALRLERYFDLRTARRGRAYQRQGYVDVLTVSLAEDGRRMEVSALVSGSIALPYRCSLSLSLENGHIEVDGSCTCPVGDMCKHMAASLEELKSQRSRPSPAQIMPAAAPTRKAQDLADRRPGITTPSISAPVRAWLEQCRRLENGGGDGPLVPSECSPGQTAVRYALFPANSNSGQDSGGLCMSFVICRRKKNGAWGKPRIPKSASWRYRQFPAEFSSEDRRLAAEVFKVFEESQIRRGENRFIPNGRLGAVLLREILESGRALWGTDFRNVIQPGEARALTGLWQEGADAIQHAALRFADSGKAAFAVAQLDPALYVDPDQLAWGEAIWNAAVPLSHWLTAPAVQPAETGSVRKALAEWVPDGETWTPRQRKVRGLTPEEAAPKSKVRLFTGNAVHSLGGGARSSEAKEPVLLLELSFRYGDAVVPEWDPDRHGTHRQSAGDEVLEFRRDLPAEDRFVGQLSRAGLTHLGAWPYSVDLVHRRFSHCMGFRPELGKTGGNRTAWMRFVSRDLPEMVKQGCEVEFAPDFPFQIAKADSFWGGLDEAEGGQADWFRFDYGVEIDGERISLLQALANYLAQAGPDFDPHLLFLKSEEETVPVFIEEKGLIVGVPAQTLGRILTSVIELFQWESSGPMIMHAVDAGRIANSFPELVGVTSKRLRALQRKLAQFSGVEAVKPPPTLKADLRHYQEEGLGWLQFLRQFQLGGILADDMGLGKTVQTLAHLLVERRARRAEHPSLIVAPTSVLANWKKEAERFAPVLKVLLLQGPGRSEHFEAIPEHDLILTSYALLPRDAETLSAHRYHFVILDEAQYIKNPASRATQAVFDLKANHRLCLTGTPIENHLGELWSLFHFLMPGFLGDRESFQRHWRRPIEREDHTLKRDLLIQRVSPLILRRTRGQVLKELPPRTDIVESIDLHPSQANLYEVIRAAMDKRVREAIRAKGLARSQIVVLDALLKLRQVCCDPRLLKIDSARKAKHSAKLDHFRDLVRNLVQEGRRILVFSQFTSMLALIHDVLEEEKIGRLALTGDTPGAERQKLIDRFQSEDIPLFLISLKAGGAGLNLTAADTVIHFDPWWNPAVEEQATGRAHRMGQTNPVFVYRLITKGTIEERILELQQRKAAVARAILGDPAKAGETGRNQGLALQREDLERLLAPLSS